MLLYDLKIIVICGDDDVCVMCITVLRISLQGNTVSIIILQKYNSKKYYNLLHNLLKFLIVLGVLSIVLIDFDLFLDKFYLLFNYLI